MWNIQYLRSLIVEWEPIQMVHRKCCFRSCPTTVLSVTSGGTNSGDHFYFKLMAHLSDFNIISRMLKVIFPNIFSKSILCFTYFNFHLFIKCLNVVGRKHPLFAVCVTLHSLSCIFFFFSFWSPWECTYSSIWEECQFYAAIVISCLLPNKHLCLIIWQLLHFLSTCLFWNIMDDGQFLLY